MEEEIIERTRIILNRCKEHNITISRKKLELGTELGFAGHIVSLRTASGQMTISTQP